MIIGWKKYDHWLEACAYPCFLLMFIHVVLLPQNMPSKIFLKESLASFGLKHKREQVQIVV